MLDILRWGSYTVLGLGYSLGWCSDVKCGVNVVFVCGVASRGSLALYDGLVRRVRRAEGNEQGPRYTDSGNVQTANKWVILIREIEQYFVSVQPLTQTLVDVCCFIVNWIPSIIDWWHLNPNKNISFKMWIQSKIIEICGEKSRLRLLLCLYLFGIRHLFGCIVLTLLDTHFCLRRSLFPVPGAK